MNDLYTYERLAEISPFLSKAHLKTQLLVETLRATHMLQTDEELPSYMDLDQLHKNVCHHQFRISYGQNITPRTDRGVDTNGKYMVFVRSSFYDLDMSDKVSLACEFAVAMTVAPCVKGPKLLVPHPNDILADRDFVDIQATMLLVPFVYFKDAVENHRITLDDGRIAFSLADAARDLKVPEKTLMNANILYGFMDQNGML